jgi:hypothetical protein
MGGVTKTAERAGTYTVKIGSTVIERRRARVGAIFC